MAKSGTPSDKAARRVRSHRAARSPRGSRCRCAPRAQCTISASARAWATTELLPPPTEVSEEEITSALALMDTMTVDRLEGPEFTDRYTEAVAQIIEAKREDKPLPAVEEPEQPAQVLDLMAALQESVSKAKASRGDAGPADVHELPQPKKKTAARKPPAKQAGAKKTVGRRPRSA
ncbi:hypothetical protein [Streptomyces achromogenes]|uniref:hypothetical protein n=1 Tax=Streptomyces achromogenes TaxID=67255 RepID=UPI0033C2B232